MVGFSAIFSSRQDVESPRSDIESQLCWTGDETVYNHTDERVEVTISFHNYFSEQQPVVTNNNLLIWVWGDVKGYEVNDKYQSRDGGTGKAELCAQLYNKFGFDFVSKINGEFAGIVYDPRSETVYAFTDLLGSRPIYFARGDDNELILTTQIQLIPKYSCFSTAFNHAYLCEYICYNRVFGIHTPLNGVKKLPPASILKFNLRNQCRQQDRYWYPSLNPANRSYQEVIREFIRVFRESLNECIDPNRTNGLMLSGGSDSRLILAACNDLISFHICDWMNREARIARRVADTANSDFYLLQRGNSYFSDIIDISCNINSFNGFFQEGHALGFRDDIINNADVTLIGMFSDALFKDHLLPLRELTVLKNTAFLPIKKRVETLDEYIDIMSRSVPNYYTGFKTTREILEDNITTSEKVNHHGVKYNSISELIQQANYYPLTNDPDYFHYQSSIQMTPHRTPFLDKRMIEFHLSIPNKYRLRKDIISDAVTALNSNLAKIPHSSTLSPLKCPYLLHWTMNNIRKFKEKYFPTNPPRPYFTDSPWPDYEKLLKQSVFGDEEIEEVQDEIQSLPFIERSEFNRLYEEISTEGGEWRNVYSVLTLGHMPIIKRGI